MQVNVFVYSVYAFCAFQYYVNGEISEHITVTTLNGDVRGHLKQTLFQNVSYYAFLGIPYAEKPIGDLRFQAPMPIASWQPRILDALHYANSCIQQSNALGNSGPASEDCLYLNIFVPVNIKPNKKLAVLFFIHGGGYAEGSGNDFYYGIFGFLSLGTNLYSGNMGLKDQQMALKWIHNNIHAFHGDPRRITLMGQSAGAVSVHYHVLIPESRELINGAICLSGSAFLRYAYSDEKNHLNQMFAFAQKQNISTVDELVEFLKHVSTQTLVNETSQSSFDLTLMFDWAPVLEQNSSNHPIIIQRPEAVYDSDVNVNVDMMFGYTNYECLGLSSAIVSNVTKLNDFMDKFNVVLPVHGLKPDFQSKAYRKLLNKVDNHYFGNVTTEHDSAMQFVDMISDLNMVTPIDKAVKTQAKHSNRSTYYYQFSIDGKLNYMKRQLNIPWPGATHCDDLCYIFRCHSIDSVYGDIRKTMRHDESSKITYDTIHLMSTMYANFAKYRNPNVNGKPARGFKPVDGDEIHFLNIKNDALILGTSPKKQDILFWNNILQQAHKPIR